MIARHHLHTSDREGEQQRRRKRRDRRPSQIALCLRLQHEQCAEEANDRCRHAPRTDRFLQHERSERHEPQGAGERQRVRICKRQLLVRVETQDHAHDAGAGAKHQDAGARGAEHFARIGQDHRQHHQQARSLAIERLQHRRVITAEILDQHRHHGERDGRCEHPQRAARVARQSGVGSGVAAGSAQKRSGPNKPSSPMMMR